MKNKLYYTVSSLGLNSNKNKLDLFLSDKYLEDVIDSKEYVNKISFTRTNQDEFTEDVQFLDTIYKLYITQMVEILNKEHNKNYNYIFWQKALGLGFRRFIHLTYDAYKIHKNNFNPDKFDFATLDENSFIVTSNFENHRQSFEHSEIGFEQLFSLYINTFYSDLQKNEKFNIQQKKKSPSNKNIFKSYINKFSKTSFHKITYKLLKVMLRFKKPTIGMLYSFFDAKYRNILLVKSFGNINEIDIKINHQPNSLNIELRKKLFQNFTIKSNFDKFFKNSLIYTFPTFFIEDFSKVHQYYLEQAQLHRNLKYIISEAWLSNTYLSFFLALSKDQFNIKHIYNEHNYLSHPYLGNHAKLLSEMTDCYYTMGWKPKNNNKYKNIVQGASLFEFNIPNSLRKKEKILYVSAPPLAKLAEISSAYGEIQENAIRYLKFKTIFFNNIHSNVYKNIIYRKYPVKDEWIKFNDLSFNKNNFFSIDDLNKSAKQMMRQSKLVIIDYLSTSHLESLIMNIPSIVFFNKETYYLEEEYTNIYDELINVGIFQTSPLEAAKFVNKLIENDSIEEWWQSEKTQNARKQFIDSNIGNPDDAVSFYLSLAK